MEKQVNKLHLIYGYVISGLLIVSIVVCWILSCKGIISENAFQNFSFASSIVSIVLALVSIVYTIYSGSGVSNSIDILRDAEQNIKTQVEALNGLENRIIGAVEEVNNGLSTKISEVQNQIDPFIKGNINAEKGNRQEDLIDIPFNSVFGNILLYICIKSNEKNKAWPIDILGNEIKLYFQGSLVAMASIPTLKFFYDAEGDFQIIKSCRFEEIDKFLSLKPKILTAIKSKLDKKQSDEVFKVVDDYFDKPNE